MKIYVDYTTIKAGKRFDPQNPITAAFNNISRAIIASKDHELCDREYADLVFVFGSITNRKLDTERAVSITEHRKAGRKILSLDSALFSTYIRRFLASSETYMFRVGYGDCTGEGNYLNENSSKERYERFKTEFKFTERSPQSDNTKPILFALQSEKGWMYNNEEPYFVWAKNTIAELRRYTDRTIVLKPHPNTDRYPVEWIKAGFTNIEVLGQDRTRRDIIDDFQGVGAVVTHSSSAACESIVEGIPTFALDKRCVVYDACEHDFSKINNLQAIDWSKREQTLWNWANTSWHLKELENPQLISYYIEKATNTL